VLNKAKMNETIIDIARWQLIGRYWIIFAGFIFLVVAGILGYTGIWKSAKGFLEIGAGRFIHGVITLALGVLVLDLFIMAIRPSEVLVLRATDKYVITTRTGANPYVVFDRQPNGLRVIVSRSAMDRIDIGRCYRVEFVPRITSPNNFDVGLDRISTADDGECK
jgi:hypothetical protein